MRMTRSMSRSRTKRIPRTTCGVQSLGRVKFYELAAEYDVWAFRAAPGRGLGFPRRCQGRRLTTGEGVLRVLRFELCLLVDGQPPSTRRAELSCAARRWVRGRRRWRSAATGACRWYIACCCCVSCAKGPACRDGELGPTWPRPCLAHGRRAGHSSDEQLAYHGFLSRACSEVVRGYLRCPGLRGSRLHWTPTRTTHV